MKREFMSCLVRRLHQSLSGLVIGSVLLVTVCGQETSRWRIVKKLVAKPHRLFAIDSDPSSAQPDRTLRVPVLDAIFFADDLNGCAAGDSGTLVCTANGGRTWMSKVIDNSVNLHGGFFRNDREGWVVGDAKGAGLVLRTEDAGNSWHVRSKVEGFRLSGLHAVWFADAQHGWTAGEAQQNGITQGVILATDDGGVHWRPQYLSERSSVLSAIHFVDAQHGWAVGHNLILHTDNGGLEWREQRVVEGEYFFDVDPTSFTEAWVVGSNGSLLKTNDGGLTWHAYHLPSKYKNLWLASVRFVTPGRGWVVGNDGAIFSTKDGGKKWELESIGASQYLRSLTSTSHSIFVVGNCGTILRRNI